MNDTIDLGHSAASGGSQKFDFENNAGAVVDTGDDIADAGGPQGVLVGSQEAASEVTSVIGEVTGQLRDMQSQGEPSVTDNTDQNQPANAPGEMFTQYVPVPQGGDGGLGKALLVAVVAALAFAFGGN